MRIPLVPALNDVIGVALTFQPDGTWSADYCRLLRQRGSVTVTQQGVGLSSARALQQELAPEPVALAIALAGRGLLLRTLPVVAPDQTPSAYDTALATALPGVSLKDFYVQYEPLAAGVHAALIRKSLVDQLLGELHAAGLWVVSLSLGSASMTTLLPYLPAATKQLPIRAGGFCLQLSAAGDALTSVEYQPAAPVQDATYMLGNEKLAALVAPATEPAVPRVQELATEWDYRHLFQRLKLAVPVLILVLLMGNFLVSQQLTTDREHLMARRGNNQQLLQQLRQLQQTTSLKHAFLMTSGWAQPSWNALCADRLVASLPTGLELLNLDVNPPQDPAAVAGRAVEFRHDVVMVHGQCHDAQRFNAWLQLVSKLPWVQAVRDQNFTYDYAGGVGTFTFTLVVKPARLLRA
jgi:hypothetical protein